ncbi:MAG: hypothetical protein KGJ37_00990, partial [Verrucomicrobiota bacterium]|nr:hypothetical protein [Verrucomicrobiota bacterium]
NVSCLAFKRLLDTDLQSLIKMDTLSRDSNSSGSILPLVGVIAGGLATFPARFFSTSPVGKSCCQILSKHGGRERA